MVSGQLFFAALVVLMGTAWGAISLWAATSKLPWAARLFAVALPLVLFTSVPAYEPVLFFALQSIVIAVGVALSNQREAKAAGLNFSLKSLLVATVVASLLLAIGTRTNIPSRWTWLSLFAGSISLGIATLLAAWKIRWWKKLFLVPIGLAVAAVPMGLWDALLLAFPEWDRGAMAMTLVRGPMTTGQLVVAGTSIWFTVLLATYVWLCAILGCWSFAHADDALKKWIGRVGVVALLALSVLPVGYVYAFIPPPTPERPVLAGKNGYDLMTEARKHFVGGGAIDFPDQATNEELRAKLEMNEQAMAMFREMIDLPFQPPPGWGSNNSLIADAGLLREMARAFEADSILARREGRLDDAVNDSLAVIQIARMTDEANLMLGLVSIAIEAMGHQIVADLRTELDPEQSRRVITELTKINVDSSTHDDLLAAEAEWAQRMWGWRKQLYEAFSTATGIDDMEAIVVASRSAVARSDVTRRLLLLDLAIRNYQRANGSPPKSLEELELDETLLVDAYAVDGTRFHYEPLEDSYKLYGVGPDGVDNGGVPIGDRGWNGDGDYLLESLFAEEPEASPGE